MIMCGNVKARITFNPLRGCGGACILYPEFHSGLFMFNPFGIFFTISTNNMGSTANLVENR